MQTYLKESFQPPDLEDTFSNQDAQLEYTPPFHSCVRAFSRVSMDSLSDNDIGLLVFDLVEELGELFHCGKRLRVSMIILQSPKILLATSSNVVQSSHRIHRASDRLLSRLYSILSRVLDTGTHLPFPKDHWAPRSQAHRQYRAH